MWHLTRAVGQAESYSFPCMLHWHGRSMRYNKSIRSETREAWNKNGMDAGGVLFFLVARAVCACIYVMVLLLLLC